MNSEPGLQHSVKQPSHDCVKEGRGCRTEGTFRDPNDFGVNKGLPHLPYLQKIGRKINRYFVTPYGWKVARLFSRLEARVFRPAMAMFTTNDAVLPFPLRQALDLDAQLDLLIYGAFPLPKAS